MGLIACSPPTGGPRQTPGLASFSTIQTAVVPVAQPLAPVAFSETQVTLPTYPFEHYQSDGFDLVYRWPYKRFDVERFRAEAP
jgi:hypothetical protein